eukprot:403377062
MQRNHQIQDKNNNKQSFAPTLNNHSQNGRNSQLSSSNNKYGNHLEYSHKFGGTESSSKTPSKPNMTVVPPINLQKQYIKNGGTSALNLKDYCEEEDDDMVIASELRVSPVSQIDSSRQRFFSSQERKNSCEHQINSNQVEQVYTLVSSRSQNIFDIQMSQTPGAKINLVPSIRLQDINNTEKSTQGVTEQSLNMFDKSTKSPMKHTITQRAITHKKELQKSDQKYNQHNTLRFDQSKSFQQPQYIERGKQIQNTQSTKLDFYKVMELTDKVISKNESEDSFKNKKQQKPQQTTKQKHSFLYSKSRHDLNQMSPRNQALNFSGFLSDSSNPMRFSDVNEGDYTLMGLQSSNIRSKVDLHNEDHSQTQFSGKKSNQSRSRNSNCFKNKTLNKVENGSNHEHSMQNLPLMRSMDQQLLVHKAQLNYTFSLENLQNKIKLDKENSEQFISANKVRFQPDRAQLYNEDIKQKIVTSQLQIYKQNQLFSAQKSRKSPNAQNPKNPNNTSVNVYDRLQDRQDKWIKQKIMREQFINDQLVKIQEKKSKTRRRFKSNDFGNNQSLNNNIGDFMSRTKMFEQRKETNLHKLDDRYYGSLTSRKCSSFQNEVVPVNQKSLEYICQRLHRDIDHVLDSTLQTKEGYISRDEYQKCLTLLGYTQNISTADGQDSNVNLTMQDKLWNLMSNNKQLELIPILSLKIYLTAIEGVFFPWMIKPVSEQVQDYIDVIFLKDQDHAAQISKKFFSLLQSRRRFLDQEKLRKTSQKRLELEASVNQYNFFSMSNKKHSNMGSMQSSTEAQEQKIDRFNKLYQEDYLRTRSKEPRPVTDIEYERSETQCTFVPITNHSLKKIKQSQQNQQSDRKQISVLSSEKNQETKLSYKMSDRKESKVSSRLNDDLFGGKQSTSHQKYQLFSPKRKDCQPKQKLLSPKILHKSDLNSTSHYFPQSKAQTTNVINSSSQYQNPQVQNLKSKPTQNTTNNSLTLKPQNKMAKNSHILKSRNGQSSNQTLSSIKMNTNQNQTISSTATLQSISKLDTQRKSQQSINSTKQSINKSSKTTLTDTAFSQNDQYNKIQMNKDLKKEVPTQATNQKIQQHPEVVYHSDKKNQSNDNRKLSTSPEYRIQDEAPSILSPNKQQMLQSGSPSRENSKNSSPKRTSVQVQNQDLQPHNQLNLQQLQQQAQQQQQPLSSQILSPQIPLLFLDVNLGNDKMQRIIINEGDNVQFIVDQFCNKHKLNPKKRGKLLKAIESQLAGHLHCIQEED